MYVISVFSTEAETLLLVTPDGFTLEIRSIIITICQQIYKQNLQTLSLPLRHLDNNTDFILAIKTARQ